MHLGKLFIILFLKCDNFLSCRSKTFAFLGLFSPTAGNANRRVLREVNRGKYG